MLAFGNYGDSILLQLSAETIDLFDLLAAILFLHHIVLIYVSLQPRDLLLQHIPALDQLSSLPF